MNELAPARTKLLDGIANLVRDAWAVNDIGARHQVDMYTLGRGILPPADPSDELSDFIFREMLGSLVNECRRTDCGSIWRADYGTLPPWAHGYLASTERARKPALPRKQQRWTRWGARPEAIELPPAGGGDWNLSRPLRSFRRDRSQ